MGLGPKKQLAVSPAQFDHFQNQILFLLIDFSGSSADVGCSHHCIGGTDVMVALD